MGINIISKKCLISCFTVFLVISLLVFGFTVLDVSKIELRDELLVIIDTDLGPDVDDVLAITQLHALDDLNEVEILATVYTSSFNYGPGALSALNKWHGRKVPIGALRDEDLYNVWLGEYTKPLYENFPRYAGLRHTVGPHRFVPRRGRLSWNSTDDGSTWSDHSEGPHDIVDGYVGTSQDLMNELEALTWSKQFSTPDN